jgi:hypothetical protein
MSEEAQACGKNVVTKQQNLHGRAKAGTADGRMARDL